MNKKKVLNKISKFEGDSDSFYNDFTILTIRRKDKNYKISYHKIFDDEFYRRNLLAIEHNFRAESYLLFKNSETISSFNILDRVKEDLNNAKIIDKVEVFLDRAGSNDSMIEDINLRHNLLNLLFRSLIKFNDDKSIMAIPHSDETMIYQEGKSSKNHKVMLLLDFQYEFFDGTGYGGAFLIYKARNLAAYDIKKDDDETPPLYGLYEDDIVSLYTKSALSGPYEMKQINKQTRTRIDELSLGVKPKITNASNSSIVQAKIARDRLNSFKQQALLDILEKFEKVYGDYFIVEFLSLNDGKFNHYEYDESKGERYTEEIIRQFAGKTVAVINNVNSDQFDEAYEEFKFLLNESPILQNANVVFVDNYEDGFDYIINLVRDPDYYEDNNKVDPYIKHDENSTPIKNYIIDEDDKSKLGKNGNIIHNAVVRGKIENILLSLILEEDIKNLSSNLLLVNKLSDFKQEYFIHKNTKRFEYLYKLTINPNGSILLEGRNDEEGVDKIYTDKFNEDCELFQKRFPKSKTNKNHELIIRLDDGKENYIERTKYKPMIDLEFYKYILSPEGRDLLPNGVLENKDKKSYSFKGSKIKDRLIYSYLDVWTFSNYYISAYKSKNMQQTLPTSAIARRVIGPDSELIISSIIEEIFMKEMMRGNNFSVFPLAYKYLNMYKNLVEGRDERESFDEIDETPEQLSFV